MKNIAYVFNIIFSILIIGSILILSSVKSTSAGYGFILFGLLGMLFINLMFVSKENLNSSILDITKKMVTTSLPLVLFIGCISWLFAQNLTHREKIINRETPKEYTQFLTLSSLLNIVLFFVVYHQTNIKFITKQDTVKPTSYLNIFILLLALQYSLTTIQYIILNYYNTDG